MKLMSVYIFVHPLNSAPVTVAADLIVHVHVCVCVCV